MRVIFIYTDVGIAVGYSCGIGVLSAFLKQHGHETQLIHVSEDLGCPLDLDRIIRDIEAYQPGLIAFSAMTNQWGYVRQIAECIHEHIKVPTIVGGHHASAVPHEVAAEPAIDYVCKGEGERPLLELVNRLEAGLPTEDIPNLTLKRKGTSALDGAGPLPHETTPTVTNNPAVHGHLSTDGLTGSVKESRVKVGAVHADGSSRITLNLRRNALNRFA